MHRHTNRPHNSVPQLQKVQHTDFFPAQFPVLSGDVKLLVATCKKKQTLYFELGGSSTCRTTKVALMLRGWGAKVTHESVNAQTVQSVCMHVHRGRLFPCRFLGFSVFSEAHLLSWAAHTAWWHKRTIDTPLRFIRNDNAHLWPMWSI